MSVVNTRDSPSTKSLSTPPPRLQRKRHRRKLPADNVCKEANILRPLSTLNPFHEQKRPAKKDRILTRTEAALLQEEEEARREEIPTLKRWAVEDGFIYPQPAAPAPAKQTRAQQIREATTRRAQARRERQEQPIKTAYNTFDEEAFGKRSLPPSYPRRTSLLSLEFKTEEKLTESGQSSSFYFPLRLEGTQRTQSDSALKRQT